MPDLIADTQYGPLDLPASAVVVLRWRTEPVPAAWEFVGVVPDGTLEDAIGAAAKHLPKGREHDLLATKVGGRSSELRRARPRPAVAPEPEIVPIPEGE